MSDIHDIDALRQQWQKLPASSDKIDPVLDLERRARRQTHWLRWGLLAPVLVTVVIGGSVLARAMTTRDAGDITLAAVAWIYIVAAWAGALWIARGTWRAYGETTAAFLELSVRRCRANLRATRFALWLYALQFVVVTAVKLQYAPASPMAVLTSWPVLGIGVAGFAALLAAAAWFARRQRAELGYLLELQRQINDE